MTGIKNPWRTFLFKCAGFADRCGCDMCDIRRQVLTLIVKPMQTSTLTHTHTHAHTHTHTHIHIHTKYSPATLSHPTITRVVRLHCSTSTRCHACMSEAEVLSTRLTVTHAQLTVHTVQHHSPLFQSCTALCFCCLKTDMEAGSCVNNGLF